MKQWPKRWLPEDLLSGDSYERSGNEMRASGLYVDLEPWQCHVFWVRPWCDEKNDESHHR